MKSLSLPVFMQVRGPVATPGNLRPREVAPRERSEPSTYRSGGRFTQGVKLPFSWSELVCSSSGYSSMSLVSAPFWHARGTGGVGVAAADHLVAKYAQTVAYRRLPGLCGNGESVGIGPRRPPLWSALVVSNHAYGFFVPKPSPCLATLRRWAPDPGNRPPTSHLHTLAAGGIVTRLVTGPYPGSTQAGSGDRQAHAISMHTRQ